MRRARGVGYEKDTVNKIIFKCHIEEAKQCTGDGEMAQYHVYCPVKDMSSVPCNHLR